ncbi:hypothetical protein [Metapseudomonas sp. CR3202]|uniref:hypothetical protein n=1 Tax=Pseudomonas sp. CR3202 TaxID=3351532 RepID=UPI003BF52F5F
MWRTANKAADDFPEDALLEYLRQNEKLFDKIIESRALLTDLVAMIVCEVGESDRPHGYSIAPELIYRPGMASITAMAALARTD